MMRKRSSRPAGWARIIAALWLTLLALAAAPAHAETRIALVIANSAYSAPSLGRLPGTQGDAAVMKAALEAAGFRVRSVPDLKKEEMRRAIADFTRDLSAAGKDGVGFLYYSGHGIADARRGQNYLIPVDADVRAESDLPLYALAMDDLLDAVEAAGAKAAFVVFDACRSTPTSLTRGSKGLQPARPRTDTLIAFATAPGETASDNGLYARVLAAELQSAGSESDTLFQRVQRKVAASTARQQVPQFVSGLAGDPIQFRQAMPIASTTATYVQPAVPATTAPTAQGPSDPAAMVDLARNLDAKKNYEEALRWLRLAADSGNAVAMRSIGFHYRMGQGVAQNNAEAMRWYRKAADLGEPAATHNIGVLYDHGQGVPQDYAEAMRWYRKAADLGVATSMTSIGYLYEYAHGVPQDYAEAMRWYRKAAELGEATAMTKIGLLYDDGQGVPQDYAEAMRWYRKAAELGEPNATTSIGALYGSGHGVPQDFAEAMRWYRKAADLGEPYAITNIGWYHHNGYGVTTNFDEARRWWERAAALGHEPAKKALAQLKTEGH